MFTAGQGLEPQYHASEACVLPLDEPAMLFNNPANVFNLTNNEIVCQLIGCYAFKYRLTAIKLETAPSTTPMASRVKNIWPKLEI